MEPTLFQLGREIKQNGAVNPTGVGHSSVVFSSGVNSKVHSTESSAELVWCASLDRPGTTTSTKLSHLQGANLPFLKRFGV